MPPTQLPLSSPHFFMLHFQINFFIQVQTYVMVEWVTRIFAGVGVPGRPNLMLHCVAKQFATALTSMQVIVLPLAIICPVMGSNSLIVPYIITRYGVQGNKEEWPKGIYYTWSKTHLIENVFTLTPALTLTLTLTLKRNYVFGLTKWRHFSIKRNDIDEKGNKDKRSIVIRTNISQ